MKPDPEGDPGDQPTQEHQAPEITFDEQFYPARPKRFRPSARRSLWRRRADRRGDEEMADNREYVEWLVEESMLHDANRLASQLSGSGSMWQNPFAHPDPRAAVERASVWFTAYPLSFVTGRGESYLSALADRRLWEAFRWIGIEGVHTGPVKLAGGLNGRRLTPSIDGHFDRISMNVDPEFGTEEEFRMLCATATEYEGTVIDDIVPGHTGKGADFRLAEMAYQDYPGIYHMVSIAPEDWELLPEVPEGRDSVNLDADTEAVLERRGYIIGRLQRVIFFEPGIKETNWSVTRCVKGVDGVQRRWVYLHYFKEGQPSINWLDPSFSGMRLVIGDALHALADLGAGGLRLDANGFLGAEKSAEEEPAWSEGHPLSEAANHFIASMIRKMGGFSFQELNLSMDDIKVMGESGADLSYDFVNRPAYHHALVTGDTEFLRLTLRMALDMGIDPASLVHALQNHDELTHELVHFSTVHRDDLFTWRGEQVRGEDLAEEVRQTLNTRLTGVKAPYNRTFTTNGIACTTATVIAATLGIRDIGLITPEERERIKDVHLLLAMFNALQPGVFALSGWDLAGMLTVDAADVADLIADGDTRWLNRGAHDLRGVDEPSTEGRMPAGRSLYGTLSEQLADQNSFASGLRRILEVRARYGIAIAKQIDVPDVSNKAELVMVHELTDGNLQITALNFSGEEITGSVRSEHLPPGAQLTGMFDDADLGTVDDLRSFSLTLGPYAGRSILVTPAG
ncbi:maltose alpha-D-glucosyltransferase [Solirubrobacter deserti]|uniref:Maltose alpha-D-glucosyltransferase n=1 Tax=Solirubrobacter deserti TaxID=2282478 RepID=A0ABT4RE66_9ACTN|nr:maltose alpha-D-glucosyltransferase [Solirubrobacter deserti]MDA0136830.1 maltose alpha-D-glucosyltransferase [Solirubrobacter deserti]